MSTVSDWLARAIGGLLVAVLATLVLLSTGETVAWTFAVSDARIVEVQAVLMIWFGLLGAAYGVKKRLHLGLDLAVRRLPVRARAAALRASSALVAVFGVLVAVYGGQLTRTVTNTLSATGLPAAVEYLPLVAGGLLMAFFALEDALAAR